MKKPYIIYAGEEPKGTSQLICRIAESRSELLKSKDLLERREDQLLVSNIRIIPARVSCTEVICDGVPCEWVSLRSKKDEKRVVVYIHGGGWIFGNLESSRPFSVQIAKDTGYKVLMIQYRLSPENLFPSSLEDCYKVYRWLLSKGHTPSQIAFLGDSAGGNLALALLHQLKSEGLEMPSCYVGASPVTDMTTESAIVSSKDDLIYTMYKGEQKDIFTLYLGNEHNEDRGNPLISPVFGDLKGFPPMLIHSGGVEPMTKDNIVFIDKAVSAGVDARLKIWKGMFHDFTIVGKALKESRESVKDIGKFIKKFTNK